MSESKKVFYTEAAYAAGILILALGTAMMERADFGMSMVVAPAYLIYRKVSETVSWYTFGMAEYMFQGVILAVLALFMGRFRRSYLFSFVTAVVYGVTLDLAMGFIRFFPGEGVAARSVYYIAGMLCGSVGVALLFHTYIAPEAYELFVKEVAGKTGIRIDRVKTAYDCCSCIAGVLLSFLFFGFGHFEGVKLGTVVCALVNGWLIGRIGARLEAAFTFCDALPFRKLFES